MYNPECVLQFCTVHGDKVLFNDPSFGRAPPALGKGPLGARGLYIRQLVVA